MTSYFWAVTHDFGADDAHATAEFHRQSHHVIGEDIAVFTAQQRMLDRMPDAPLIDIGYDIGPMEARRLIDRLLVEERVESVASLVSSVCSWVTIGTLPPGTTRSVGQPLARTVLSEDIVLFRKRDGTVVASGEPLCSPAVRCRRGE